MRWAAVYWLLISLLMFSSICSSTIRQKRNLSFIKRLLLQHTGSTQNKCKEASQKAKAYEIIVVPDRKSVVETASAITRQSQKNNNSASILKIIRQFITSATLREVSQNLSELINSMQSSASSSRVTNRIVEDVSVQAIQQMPQDSLEGTQKLTPVVEISRPQLRDEMIYQRPKMTHDSPSLDNFVNLMIQMPRRYSYEQIKGQTVQTFTLDNNSNVIVTEKRKTMPRPAHVDDRIKEVILGMPLSVKSNDNRLVNIQNQLNLKPSEFSNINDYVPKNKVEDDVYVNTGNIPTRYMYKQDTDNGILNFGGTSFVTFDQQDEKLHTKEPPNISAYTGNPIIVTSRFDDNLVYTNVESNVKDETRGDYI